MKPMTGYRHVADVRFSLDDWLNPAWPLEVRPLSAKDPLNVAEETLAVTCPHCGHTSDVRIPARFKPA